MLICKTRLYTYTYLDGRRTHVVTPESVMVLPLASVKAMGVGFPSIEPRVKPERINGKPLGSVNTTGTGWPNFTPVVVEEMVRVFPLLVMTIGAASGWPVLSQRTTGVEEASKLPTVPPVTDSSFPLASVKTTGVGCPIFDPSVGDVIAMA